MKKLIKSIIVLAALILTSNTFASELGINMSKMNMYAASKPSKSSGGGGIEKGDIQLDVNFIAGSTWPLVYSGGIFANIDEDGIPRIGGFYGVGGLGLMVNVDGAVHRYASVGGYLGFLGFPSVSHKGSFGVGFGARGVFHIYQLIADKTDTKVDPSKLDFYTMMHLGGVIYVGSSSSTDGSGFQGGGPTFGWGLGLRYYFTDRIGLNTEVGWLEMSVFKLGLAIKL